MGYAAKKSIAKEWAKEDLKTDFKDANGLVFADFYDGFFQLIDYHCKSELKGEYVRLVYNIV